VRFHDGRVEIVDRDEFELQSRRAGLAFLHARRSLET